MISHPGVKVNLGLNVLRKREDGFHDLETLFVPYSGIHDTLEIIKGDDFSETSASLFSRYTPQTFPFDGAQSLPVEGPSSRSSERPAESGTELRSSDVGSSGAAGSRGVYSEHFDACGPSSRALARRLSRGQSPLKQAIRQDGKLMITIARAEGVDWDPLKDLTARAYGLLDADFDLPAVKIFLEKTSPVGAGLGGGSADAAFALRMLSDLFGLGLDDATLASYAARLGSDCAFFVYNEPMIGEGRGEMLTPFCDLPFCEKDGRTFIGGCELCVTVPAGIAVSTKEAYSGIVPRDRSGLERMSLREALSLPVEQWKGALVNDFEATVFAAHPELAAIKQSLYDNGAVYASMSGSGSALFSLKSV